jgi:hypothetical protein
VAVVSQLCHSSGGLSAAVASRAPWRYGNHGHDLETSSALLAKAELNWHLTCFCGSRRSGWYRSARACNFSAAWLLFAPDTVDPPDPLLRAKLK